MDLRCRSVPIQTGDLKLSRGGNADNWMASFWLYGVRKFSMAVILISSVKSADSPISSPPGAVTIS